MLDTMRDALNAQSLRHGVGRAIFCPDCGSVMDCRRALEVTVSIRAKPVSVTTVCSACWESGIRKRVTGLTARACNLDLFRRLKPEVSASDIDVEVIDGRTIDWEALG